MEEQPKKKRKPAKKKPAKKKAPRVPYHKKPENLSPRAWQTALRKQFAADNDFEIENRGEHPVYSDFTVYNPASKSTYKVAIRSSPKEMDEGQNDNFCACYDFKTNQLGTCKHMEATLRKLWRNTRLRKFFKEKPARPYTSVYLNYIGERKVMIRVGTDQPEAFERLADRYFDEGRVLKSTALATFDKFLEKAHTLDPGFRCYEDALGFVLEERERVRRQQLLKKRIKNLKDPYFETLLKTDLFPYQREGVYFAVQAGRSLIADEMGLGKTIQAIAVAEMLRKELNISRVLIVCPTSLKYQWKSEIEKFTDRTAHVVEGGPLARPAQYHDSEHFCKIISYHTVGNDLEVINDSEPDLVILDEAQRIKNWQTKTSQSIKKVQSDYALVLTGTPLENKLEELYSIIQFINPFLLGSLFNFLQRYQITDDKGKVVGYQHLNEVSNILRDVMLRRTKKKVMKQLPTRQDKNLFVPMTEQQRTLHDDYADMVARLVNKWKRLGFLPEKDRQRLMIGLNMMRMACNSTYVIDQKTRHDTKIDELFSILDTIVDAEGEKVVVFSQWERMTRLVAQGLEERGVGFQYLHGGIPSAKRKDLFTHFNENPDCRVFLSTDAGGVGLNLQAASWMVNLDIPWNPAVLEQRIARIYRMGQRKRVSIINLVSTGTIEHRMLDVLRFKSGLAEGVLDQGEDAIFMGEDRFKKFMDSVENVVPGTGAGAETVTEMATISDEDIREQHELFAESGSNGTDSLSTTPEPEAPTNGQDEVTPEPLTPAAPPVPEETVMAESAPVEGPELMANGLKFFSQLAQTLSDKEATAKLVSSITERDEATGQTYLKVPVENQKTVEDAITMLGTLFKALQ